MPQLLVVDADVGIVSNHLLQGTLLAVHNRGFGSRARCSAGHALAAHGTGILLVGALLTKLPASFGLGMARVTIAGVCSIRVLGAFAE